MFWCDIWLVFPATSLWYQEDLCKSTDWLKEVCLKINIFSQTGFSDCHQKTQSLLFLRFWEFLFSMFSKLFQPASRHGKHWKHLAENSRGKSASSKVLNCLKPIIKSHFQLTEVHCVWYGVHCWTEFASCSSVQCLLGFLKCSVPSALLQKNVFLRISAFHRSGILRKHNAYNQRTLEIMVLDAVFCSFWFTGSCWWEFYYVVIYLRSNWNAHTTCNWITHCSSLQNLVFIPNISVCVLAKNWDSYLWLKRILKTSVLSRA